MIIITCVTRQGETLVRSYVGNILLQFVGPYLLVESDRTYAREGMGYDEAHFDLFWVRHLLSIEGR